MIKNEILKIDCTYFTELLHHSMHRCSNCDFSTDSNMNYNITIVSDTPVLLGNDNYIMIRDKHERPIIRLSKDYNDYFDINSSNLIVPKEDSKRYFENLDEINGTKHNTSTSERIVAGNTFDFPYTDESCDCDDPDHYTGYLKILLTEHIILDDLNIITVDDYDDVYIEYQDVLISISPKDLDGNNVSHDTKYVVGNLKNSIEVNKAEFGK